MISPDKIIPVRLQHELQAAGEQADQGYWRIGDICNRILGENAKLPEAKRRAVMDVYKAVGHFSGKASGTVRGYADVASFWDRDHRDEFPQFGRHHVLAVMPHAQGEALVDRRHNAAELLYKALDQWAEYGSVPTVDGLRAWLRKDNGKKPWELAWDRIVSACHRLLEHDELPSALRRAIERMLTGGQ